LETKGSSMNSLNKLVEQVLFILYSAYVFSNGLCLILYFSVVQR
jgi:hypothetical protein